MLICQPGTQTSHGTGCVMSGDTAAKHILPLYIFNVTTVIVKKNGILSEAIFFTELIKQRGQKLHLD